MRKRRIAGWIAIGVALAAGLWVRPDLALRSGAAMTAQNLCGAAFIQGVDPDATFRELVKPMSSVAGPLLRYQVDRSGKAVNASILGLLGARSQWTEGYGCRLVWDRRIVSPAPVAPRPPSAPDGFAPPSLVAPADPLLTAALDAEFAEMPGQPPRRIKAVVIVKDGKVVAEHYAPGFGIDTPLLSFSVAKSFGNAFLAILARQGKLRTDQPVGAPEWSRPGDPRATLTLDDLLRMQSGLNAAESGSGFDPVSHMLYGADDMAHFAAGHPLKEPPRTHFEYTSSNTLILDRVLGQTIGGGAPGFRAFADRELFQPLHMDGVTLEFDGAGTFSGSAYVYAPARAFARLGLLYMNDGIAPDGRRLLPEGWVAYSRRSTLGSPYGAGFWTVDGPSDQAAFLVARGFPKDGFYASGNRGQRIYVVPSERLVMVRFGYSTPPSFGITGDMALLKTAMERLHHT